MIVRLWKCEGRTCHAKVLDFKLDCKTTNELNIVQRITVKWRSRNFVSDKLYKRKLSPWCHTSYSRSCQSSTRICPHDDSYATRMHVSSCITLRTDLVHMVEIMKIAYGTSWKSRRRRLLRKVEEVKLYKSKTSGMIYMSWIAGQKRGNVIEPRLVSLSLLGSWLFWNWKATQLLDANDNTEKQYIYCQLWLHNVSHTMTERKMTVSLFLIWVSREHEWLLVKCIQQSNGCTVTFFQTQSVGQHYS